MDLTTSLTNGLDKLANDVHEKVPLWEQISQKKIDIRDQLIPPEWRLEPGQVSASQLNVLDVPASCGILTARELEITETTASKLVDKIINRQFTSYEVTLAFCKRAAIAQQLVNCLTEIFFQEALETAKNLDSQYESSGIPSGPLHGLPVSLKDCFRVEGFDTAIGYTALVDKPSSKEQESEITIIMRECGAVLFCKTNVPLALMAGETYSPIYGYTSNPYNRNLSSGGSSGGEGALLALRGSPLGIGTDVGGSIRIPASFCGLYSLKPSSGRFPMHGTQDGMDGQEAIHNSIGPMARSIEDLEIWIKAVLKCEPWMDADPKCLPIPWRDVTVPKKLCFGILMDDGIVKPLPPVTRALTQLRAALEAAGHSVIEFQIPNPSFPDTLRFELYQSAAAELINETLSKTGQPWPKGYEPLEKMVNGDCDKPVATVSGLWKAQDQRTKFAKQILQTWAATKSRTGTGRDIDGLLMPCSPWPASAKYGFTYDTYTSLWNILDYCATTLPVTHVSMDDLEADYKGRNETETDIWNDYSPKKMEGAPVSIQVVGRRLNEEYLLGVTRICDNSLQAFKYASE